MEALGYLGLGISAVLFLRAFIAIMRTEVVAEYLSHALVTLL